MMCYDKAKETNYKILEMTQKRMADIIEKGKWDAEVFNAMTDAIKNIERLEELMEVKEEKPATYSVGAYSKIQEKPKTVGTPKAKATDSEFKKVIYDIIAKKGNQESMEHITNVIDDYLKDVKVLQPRAYNSLMAKLKG